MKWVWLVQSLPTFSIKHTRLILFIPKESLSLSLSSNQVPVSHDLLKIKNINEEIRTRNLPVRGLKGRLLLLMLGFVSVFLPFLLSPSLPLLLSPSPLPRFLSSRSVLSLSREMRSLSSARAWALISLLSLLRLSFSLQEELGEDWSLGIFAKISEVREGESYIFFLINESYF